MRISLLLAVIALADACTNPATMSQSAAAPSRLEGTYEYIGTLRGQAILTGGRYVFLSAPTNGSAAANAEAGTYRISGDTAVHTVQYATDASRIGTSYKWTPQSFEGDTLSFVILNQSGQVIGRGRSVKRH